LNQINEIMQCTHEWYQKLSLKVPDGFEFVFLYKIVYIEANDKHVLIFLDDRDKPIESQSCFSEIVSKLPAKPLFYVCERSHVISQLHVDKYIKKLRLVITPKGEVPISKEHVKEFEELFCR
jgi:DNA-binding LytR/AlgR family response regulator